MLSGWSLNSAVASLALAALVSADGQCSSGYTYTTFTENFSNGAYTDNFSQLAGIPLGNIQGAPGGQGVQLQLRTGQAWSTQIATRALFGYNSKISFTLQTNTIDGVLYDAIAWPVENQGGFGEIDLELLGGHNKQVMCPIWKPQQAPLVPIVAKNSPSSWGLTSDPSGPTVDFGAATPAYSSNWVDAPFFDQTQETPITFSYTENEIEWTASGQRYLHYTKGSDASKWPGEGPMMFSFALWANPAASWMGNYQYDASNPPTLTIKDFTFSGCVKDDSKTSTTAATSTSSSTASTTTSTASTTSSTESASTEAVTTISQSGSVVVVSGTATSSVTPKMSTVQSSSNTWSTVYPKSVESDSSSDASATSLPPAIAYTSGQTGAALVNVTGSTYVAPTVDSTSGSDSGSNGSGSNNGGAGSNGGSSSIKQGASGSTSGPDTNSSGAARQYAGASALLLTALAVIAL